MNFLKWMTYSLVLIGALNWGLVGAFNFDLVAFLFGNMTTITRIVYLLVGISAIGYMVLSLRDNLECSHFEC